jgi:gluconolactonase
MDVAVARLLETTEAQRLATGFGFTEGPLWHPSDFYYFVDIRRTRLHRITPGKSPEIVRENTGAGNGTTFDLQGRLIICEGDNRRVTRYEPDGTVTVLADRYQGMRFNRPNDIACKSDGSLYFTDPNHGMPFSELELPSAAVYRILPDGTVKLIAEVEFPNGLAFSPDERLLYVANSRWTKYLLALELDDDGNSVRRHIFADMSSDEVGAPDGLKVDSEGHVFCTGPGGIWVFHPNGTHLGVIRTPEIPSNVAFGSPDLRTLFFTARTSVYAMRVKIPGLPHPWYAKR